MNVTYVLNIGEYRQRIIMVSNDVKLISKMYVENIAPEYEYPQVEIWKDNECINYFSDYEKVESKVIKGISKRAMGLK